MFKINKKVEYALIVLKHFEKNSQNDLVTVRMICDQYLTPFDTTSKVMQTMNNYGILESVQGVKGGYKVSANLDKISYLQLCQMIEGKSFVHDCAKVKCSLLESCNIVGPIKRLNESLVDFFSQLTLAQLLSEQSQRPMNTNYNSQSEGQHL